MTWKKRNGKWRKVVPVKKEEAPVVKRTKLKPVKMLGETETSLQFGQFLTGYSREAILSLFWEWQETIEENYPGE
jgi:hypothetical protein